jgi:hypothetical protein
MILEAHTPRTRPAMMDATDLFEISYLMERLLTSADSADRQAFVVYRNRQVNWCCAVFSTLMPPGIPDKCCHEVFLLNMNFTSRQ